ncbi:MAG: DNA repair protein RecN [Oscillospiraceae bacterium]|jgi:DNA repair protein RecN (Recombination protein N)|nr:DNA repair protein RecN [Oscillospiraceae bacterium]
MLSLLHIENIAVIELGDIAFDGRLNVLTGETGAGKSIVIDALSALLGQRASRDLIRSGHEAAEVSGVFSGPGTDELMLQRELRDDGRSLCRIDGKPATLSALRELGDSLVNIHGQHDSQALLREETHILYLDAFAELSLERYTGLYQNWARLNAERKTLSMAEDEKRARIDMLSHRLRELREIEPKPLEEQELSARRKLLRNAESIREALNEAYYALYGDEETRGACDLAQEAAEAMSAAARSAPDMVALAERLSDLRYALKDCAEEARDFYEGMEGSEEELETIEARLDALNRLRRKHNMELSEILEAGERWAAELESLEFADMRLAELEGEMQRAEEALLTEAQVLTEQRTEAARRLEERMTGELSDLDMGKVRLEVAFEQTEPKERGRDSIRFLIAANVGEPLKPLSKIASGGEMARIMLAMKNLLAEGDSVQTLVFDEVDSGVSGRAAQRVAQKLCAVSRRKQVLCVTHLPQIAAFADSHFHVEKAVEEGRTVTRVQKLGREGRIEELARIMAGASVTDTTRKTAEELLGQAETYKKTL